MLRTSACTKPHKVINHVNGVGVMFRVRFRPIAAQTLCGSTAGGLPQLSDAGTRARVVRGAGRIQINLTVSGCSRIYSLRCETIDYNEAMPGQSHTAQPARQDVAPSAGKELVNSVRAIQIYTDGSCLGNPGPGGWAYIIQDGDQRKEASGHCCLLYTSPSPRDS